MGSQSFARLSRKGNSTRYYLTLSSLNETIWQFHGCLSRFDGPPSCFKCLVVGWCFTTTPALSSEFACRCEFGCWPVIIRRQKLAGSKPAHHHLSAVLIVKFLRLRLNQWFTLAEWSELVSDPRIRQVNSIYWGLGSSSNLTWASITTFLELQFWHILLSLDR